MAKLYTVLIRWVKTPVNHVLIDGVLTRVGMDWLRYDAWSWFSYSNSSALDITGALREVLHPEDSILVIEANPSDYNGWSPPWMWNWLDQKKQLLQSQGLGALGNYNALNNPPY